MNSQELGKVGQASRGISLTWKVTIGLASMITLLGLLIGGVVYQLTNRALQDQFDQRAIVIATNLSDAAAAHVVSKNVLELYGLVRKYALLQGVEYAFITDGQGAVIAHTLGTFPPELKETVSTEGGRQAQRRALRFRGKIVYETSFPILGGQLGAAHLGMRRDFIEGEIRHVLLPMIGIISSIFVGGIVLCSLFVWVMTRPIRHLSHMADGMSKGDLDTAVDVRVESHDEIGDLARSLERMRTSLKAAMSRLSNGQPPLGSDEVAPYIKSRLQAVNYEGEELFAPEAVEKITRYSNGIPRLVNMICDNARLIAHAASKTHVSAEMIDEVARNLKLPGQPQVKTEAATTDYQLREDAKGVFQPTRAKAHAVDDHQRPDFEPIRAGIYTWPRSRSFLARLGTGVLLGMAVLAGAGIVLYSQENGSLAALVVNFENLAGIGIKDLAGLHRQNPEPARPELTTEVFKETSLYKSPDPQVPTTKDKEIPPTSMKTITKDRPLSTPDDVAPTAQQLGLEIYKAIYNRKIRGVEVFVEEGTVYLTGRVASENQKLAAAQAAASVPGVKEVLDQIIVNSVASQQQAGSVLAMEKVAVQDETVTGEIRNQWNNTVRDVQLSIRYEFLWKNERHPGKDNPSAAFYHPVSGDIAPGGSLPFKFTPSPALPKRSDGTFAPPSVSIAGFTEIIPQGK